MSLYLCLSCLSSCGPFIICCEGAVQLVFRFLSEGIVPYVALDLLCQWDDVNLKIFLSRHLGLLLQVNIFRYQGVHSFVFVLKVSGSDMDYH